MGMVSFGNSLYESVGMDLYVCFFTFKMCIIERSMTSIPQLQESPTIAIVIQVTYLFLFRRVVTGERDVQKGNGES